MSPVKLCGIGTATPSHTMSQAEATELLTTVVCTEERQRRLAKALYRKSGVDNRHTVVPYQLAYNWCEYEENREPEHALAGGAVLKVGANGTSVSDAWSLENLSELEITEESEAKCIRPGQTSGPTTGERMQMYSVFAPELAAESAQLALANSGLSAQQVTHLVTVSCTGFDAPGIDLSLIKRLGLSPTTQRINVGFMGCHGAINGLRTARALAASQENACVLLNATELCSLHYRYQWDNEGIIGNALFADGAASLILSSEDSEAAAPSASSAISTNDWELVDTGSCVIPDSENAMSWRVGDHGFEMMLTQEVGESIENALRPWLMQWLGERQLTLGDIGAWAVHPGGPRILAAVENSLELEPNHLSTSRSILRSHGNMSSPTVLFILERFLNELTQDESQGAPRKSEAPYCLMLGFGPGLVAEAALWKTC